MKSIKSLFAQKKHKCHDESMDNRLSFRQASFRNPPNPYHVITEPKTKKATRSLPGGGINTSSRHNNTMYENLASNEYQRRQKGYAQQQSLRHRPIEEVDEVPHRILNPNNYHTQLSSEYGSMAEDPSPTNPYSRNNHSFETSDDSEPENDIEAFYRNLYEKNMRKVERKKNKAEKVAKNAENAYYKLFYAYEEMKNQNAKMMRYLETYKAENTMLRTRVEALEKSHQAALHAHETIVYGGAPEAMCSISEINPNTIGYPPRHLQKYNNHDTNEQDEVKIFPSKEECDLPQCELPRSASNSYHMEELTPTTIKLELDETLYLNGKMMEHSTDTHVVQFQNNSKRCNNENEEPSPPIANSIVSQVNQSQRYDEQPIRRSFSDSDIRDLRLVINESMQEEKESQNRNGRNRLRRGTTRYVKVDHSSSYSTDDDQIRDAIEIQTKQLKPRGEVVHFRPSRRSILNKGTNVFRRFGPSERKAIAELDFLNDLSTNSSSGLE